MTNDDQVEKGSQNQPPARGQVRIRSNVCIDPNAFNLIPGDVLQRHSMHYGSITREQRDEMMYYEPCSICKRTLFMIQEEGCDQPHCLKSGTLSSADAATRRRAVRTRE
jgi:hypothetical protein